MNIFLPVLNIFGFCLGLMACCIILFANKTRTLSNYLLVILLLGLTLVMFQGILIDTGYIIRWPHLFRTFSPFFYLMIPTTYLYLRITIYDEKRFRKLDFLHALPALLHFFELIPWYLHDATYKKAWISRSLIDPDFIIQLKEGLLPPYFHNIIRSILALSYLIATIVLWRSTPSVKEKIGRMMHSRSYRSLKIMFLLLVFLTLDFTATLILPSPSIGRSNMIIIIMGITFIVMNLFLFSQPQLLYGLIHSHNPVNNHSIPVAVLDKPAHLQQNIDSGQERMIEKMVSSSDLDHLEVYQPILEKILLTRPYLKPGYSLIELSKETGIPRHSLSALLNKVYCLRFNDFINLHRIQYISENFHDQDWGVFTIEAIAHEAGFNSRTTFFNAIKKFTGLSPKEFFEKSKSRI